MKTVHGEPRTETERMTPRQGGWPHPKLAYSVEEAAELLSLGRTQIYRLIDLGEIQTFKVGKSRRITRRQLEDFLTRMERSGGIDRLP